MDLLSMSGDKLRRIEVLSEVPARRGISSDDARGSVSAGTKAAQFWMALKGGKQVVGDLRAQVENDPDLRARKQAVFWLGQSKDPKAQEYLTKLLQQP